jgi:hypothetical protein
MFLRLHFVFQSTAFADFSSSRETFNTPFQKTFPHHQTTTHHRADSRLTPHQHAIFVCKKVLTGFSAFPFLPPLNSQHSPRPFAGPKLARLFPLPVNVSNEQLSGVAAGTPPAAPRCKILPQKSFDRVYPSGGIIRTTAARKASMFPFSKKSVTVNDLVEVTWEKCRDWPAKHGSEFREMFEESFPDTMDDVLEEVVYYLAFADDFAFYRQLEAQPEIRHAVRDSFVAHVGKYAVERNCKPLPPGDWMRDSLMWMPSGEAPRGKTDPLENVKARFVLYGKSLERKHDRSAGERAAFMLASWCGTFDFSFIMFASPLFLGKWKGLQKILSQFRVKL